jgi:hypothetical protein
MFYNVWASLAKPHKSKAKIWSSTSMCVLSKHVHNDKNRSKYLWSQSLQASFDVCFYEHVQNNNRDSGDNARFHN